MKEIMRLKRYLDKKNLSECGEDEKTRGMERALGMEREKR